MRAKQKRYLQLVVVAAGLTCTAKASDVVTYEPDGIAPTDPIDQVYAITSQYTNGYLMGSEGLQVVVTFATGAPETVAWGSITGSCDANTGSGETGGCGLATGSAPGGGSWTLTETGDTGYAGGSFPGSDPQWGAVNEWTLTTTSTTDAITSVELEGGSGPTQVTFDRDLAIISSPITITAPGVTATSDALPESYGQEGTPGGSFGITFTDYSSTSNNYALSVQYLNEITLAGPNQGCQGSFFSSNSTVTGCGDEWNNVLIQISSSTPFDGNAELDFVQDTDVTGVPEPTSVGFVGIGMLFLVAIRRRIYGHIHLFSR